MATTENNTAYELLIEAKGLLDLLRSAVPEAPSWTETTLDGATTIIEEIHTRIERAERLIFK